MTVEIEIDKDKLNEAHRRFKRIADQLSEEEIEELLEDRAELYPQIISLDEAQAMLSCINPKQRFAVWKNIIWEIRSQFNKMTSFFLIETWSPDYRENGFLTWELIQACGSCRGDKIFFRTILYYAKRGGYKSQVENIDSTDS